MKRYYFYKRRTDIADKYKKDLIAFSLSAYYSEECYSQKERKKVTSFSLFDEIDISITTKTKGIFQAKCDSGTDGCQGHWAKNLKQLKSSFEEKGYILISERNYFRLRKFAFHLIFKNIKFPIQEVLDAQKCYFYQNKYSSGFYDIRLISTSEKYNIRNLPDDTLKLYEDNNFRLYNLRVDEFFKIFFSKKKDYKTNKFEIESSHFTCLYTDINDFKDGYYLDYKNEKPLELKKFQFERMKRIIIEMILEKSSLDISAIIPKQQHTVTILDL